MRVLITGATGFIGNEIINDLHKENHDISIITRNKNKAKQDFLTVYENFDEISDNSYFDFIINLAGAPISKKWSRNYKKTLIESRVKPTREIYNLVKRLNQAPKALLSASAIGYYGSQGDAFLSENSAAMQGFTHNLCMLWEQEALRLEELGVRVIIARLGVVLGRKRGILKETVPIFKMCLGGKIGDGKQYLSWIHIYDVVQAIKFLLFNNSASGVYNLTAATPVTNEHWTKALAKALHRPALIPLPSFIVKMIFGEMGENLLLKGQRVVPKKLLSSNFVFAYDEIESALAAIFSKCSHE